MSSIRSLRDHLRFRLGLYMRLGIDIGMVLAGLVLIRFGGSGATDLIGAALSIVSAILLFLDVRARHRQASDTRIVPNPDAPTLLASATAPPGSMIETVGSLRFVTDAAFNALLDGAANPLAFAPRPYEMPRQFAGHVARCVNLDRPQFNELKVGLRTDLDETILRRNLAVAVQRTDYFSGRATNERTMDQFEVIDSERRGRAGLDVATADWVVADGRLIPLADSKLSNHIGITTLTVTADHHVVVQEQGNQVQGRYELNIGGSGSADLADAGPLAAPRTLQAFLRVAMEREAAQETGIAIGPGRARTTLTGFARYLERGGKPEFFGITLTRSNEADIKVPKCERSFVHDARGIRFEPGVDGLVAVIDDLLAGEARSPKPYSLSKSVGLRLARAHLLRHGMPPGP